MRDPAQVRHLGDALRGFGAGVRSTLCPVVFDAELVLSQRGAPVMWVHDLLAACGTQLAARPFRDRFIECARVVRSIRLASPPAEASAMRIVRKHWWPAARAREVLADPRNAQCDGLIFAPWAGAYVTGVDATIFKWKFPDRVTVDFMVTATDQLLLLDGKPPAPGEELLNPDARWRDELVESAWCYERKGWVALHVRPDKPRANSRDTYTDTVAAIAECVTKEDVFAAVE